MKLKTENISAAIFWILLSTCVYASNQDTTGKLSESEKQENTVRFGLSYSALNTMFFSNAHLKDNRQVSLTNIQPSIDYFISANSFLTLNFGYNFYTYYTGGVFTLYDEHMDHFFAQILYSKYIEDLYWGVGLGFSYTYHICEYEDEIYQYFPMLGEYLHVGNEYYLSQQRSSSIDLTSQIVVDVSKYFNFGIKADIALINLRDDAENFTNKITIGLLVSFKYPSFKK
jgi:hypothetical protein